IFFFYLYRRQQQINSLCDLIETTLQTGRSISGVFHIAYENDELTALFQQIQKISDRLCEHDLLLQKDKKYLKDFINNISRQLRIPLTSINIVASFLAAGNLSPQRQNELIQELNSLLAETNHLITTLLKIIRLDAGAANFRDAAIDVRTVLDKAAKPLAKLFNVKNIALNIETSEAASIQGDEAWIAVALGNIIKNSLESPDVNQIDINFVQNSTFTEIQIKDNGKGFDSKNLTQLFERSYRGKTVQELNLSADLTLSRLVIGSQNGTVTAEDLKSGGTCFVIKFYHPINTGALTSSHNPQQHT
ncbi:MAG: HAMP domain-containing histidine kinase, partial [Gracilibacteraceae bacterium]|nr:HAMP domain-containing histidine kinase [Gracilibacteraceae bacterium]